MKKIYFKKSFYLLIALLSSFSLFSQNSSLIHTYNRIGCNNYEDAVKNDYETIQEDECLDFCKENTATFIVVNPENNLQDAIWNVNYGDIVEFTTDLPGEGGTKIEVEWEDPNYPIFPSISVELTYTDGTVLSETICINLKEPPKASFDIIGLESEEVVCSSTNLQFNDTSIAGDKEIVSYYWDFGDGNHSYESSPSYNYEDPGVYDVTLEVTDGCTCRSVYSRKIKVEHNKFDLDLSCPTVVCEGDVEVYSIMNTELHCNPQSLLWDVDGGQIESFDYSTGSVSVHWNDVDEDGFGYLYVDTSTCNQSCPQKSVYQIPVVQAEGEIKGPEYICNDEQVKYALPKWPTTEVDWVLEHQGENVNQAIIIADQVNEVIIDANNLPNGEFVLKANYKNTLLGCVGDAEIEIEIRKKLEINDDIVTFCIGDEAFFSNSNYDYYTAWKLMKDGEVVTHVEVIDFTHTFEEPGFYNLVSEAGGFCPSDALLIEVLPPPDIPDGNIDGETEICAEQPYIYKFSDTSYGNNLYWEVENGTFNGGNIGDEVSVVFDEEGPYVLEVREQIPGTNCISEPVTLQPTLIDYSSEILHNESEDEFCSSSTHIFTADIDDGEVYDWSIDPPELGNIATGQGTNEVEIIFFEPTNNQNSGQINLEIRKCGTKHEQIPYDFTVKQDPQISIEVDENVCALDPTDIVIQSTPPLDLATTGDILLSIGNGQVLNEYSIVGDDIVFENVEFSNVSENIGRVLQVTIENPNGCDSPIQESKNITVLPAPVFELIPPSSTHYCEFEAGNVSFDFEVSIQSSTYEIQWLQDNQEINNENGTNFTANEAGVYQARITNTNGCAVYSTPISISMHSCEGSGGGSSNCTSEIDSPTLSLEWTDCNTVIATSTYDTNTAANFEGTTWNISSPVSDNDYNIINESDNSMEFEFDGIGQYKVRFSALYDEDCSRAISESIIIGYQPRLFYSGSCNFNENDYTITLFNESTFFQAYTPDDTVIYEITDLNTNTTTTLDLNSPDANFEFAEIDLSPGAYEFSLTIGKDDLPTCTTTESLTLSSLPDASFEIVPYENCDPTDNCSFCKDSGILFSPINYNENHQYNWDINNLTISTHEFISTLDDGQNLAQLFVSDQFGCQDASSTGILVYDNSVSGGVLSPDPDCLSEDFNEITFDSNDVIQEIQWMLGAEEIPGANAINYLPLQEGSYWAKLTTDEGCLFNSEATYVYAIQPPNIALDLPAQACPGEKFRLNANIPAPDIEYRILREGIEVVAWTEELPISYEFIEADEGEYEYKLEIVDLDTGCVNTESQEINIVPPPEISISYELDECNPYQVELSLNLPNGLQNVEWLNWNNGLSYVNGPNQEIIVERGGAYKVWVKFYDSDCLASAEIFVPKHPEEFIWIFPDGCFDNCGDKGLEARIIGPVPIFAQYEWNDSYLMPAGEDTYVEDYHHINYPVESLKLALANFGCTEISESLTLNFINSCDDCQNSFELNTQDVNLVEEPYLHYQIDLQAIAFDQSVGYNLSFEDFYNEGTLSPNNHYLAPGSGVNNFTLQYIPDVYPTNQLILYFQAGKFGELFCNGEKTINLENPLLGERIDLVLHQNPVKENATISYKIDDFKDNYLLEIYNMQGANIYRKKLAKPEATFSIESLWPIGTYILVLKKNGKIVEQELIIKK